MKNANVKGGLLLYFPHLKRKQLSQDVLSVAKVWPAVKR